MRKEIHSISDLGKGPPATGNVPVFTTDGWDNSFPHVLNARWFGLHKSNNAVTNQTALNDVYNELPANGGTIELPGDSEDFAFTGPWIINKPVRLIGAGNGQSAQPTLLTADVGNDAIIITGLSRRSHLSDFALASTNSGSGVGLRIRGTRTFLENMNVNTFGGHGVFFDTAARPVTAAVKAGTDAVVTVANHNFQIGEQVIMGGFTASTWNGAKIITAVTTDTFSFVAGSIAGDATVLGTVYAGNGNISQIISLQSNANGGDGLRLEGADSNAVSVYGGDCSGNGGYGYVARSSKCSFFGLHASANLATITDGSTTIAVDYYDGGSSNYWVNPYSEGSKAFYINTSLSNDGVLRSTNYGAPSVWSGPTASPVANALSAYNVNWDITLPAGVAVRGYKFKDPAGVVDWRINSGQSAIDQVQVRDQTNNRALLTFLTGAAGSARMTLFDGMDLNFGTVTGTKLGINDSAKWATNGHPPIVTPTITGSRGGNAALASLITELVNRGIVNDGTTT